MQTFRSARERAGLSLRAAAKELSTSFAYLHRVEAGDVVPGQVTLCKLADLYGVTLDQLTGRAPLPEATDASA